MTYELSEPSSVRVVVYDVLGRRVAVLLDGPVSAGEGTVRFAGGGIAPGVYVARMVAGGTAVARTLTLVR